MQRLRAVNQAGTAGMFAIADPGFMIERDALVERRKGAGYRHWHEVQYHRPQDDLTPSIDWAAAGKFNRFFCRPVAAVANDDGRPQWSPGSRLAPRVREVERNGGR